ncbi:MAG TPA: hypothetical protein VGC69_09395 [Bordetella sp.]
MLLVLAGCATHGHNFDSSKLSALTPGQTTLAQAAYVLEAPPDNIYPQSDGTTLAFWQFHISFLNDGLYSRKEAMLQFGPDGRLMRLVDSTNLLLEPWERRKLLGVAPPPAAQPAPAVAAGADSAGPQTYAIPVPAASAP